MLFDPTTAMWLNRIGLLMDFLAFWLAAPEILGEERLSAAEAVGEEFLDFLHRLLPPMTESSKDEVNAWIEKVDSDDPVYLGCRITIYGMIFATWVLILVVLYRTNVLQQPNQSPLLWLGGGSAALFVATFFVMIGIWEMQRFLIVVLRALANDVLLRRRALLLGAILFVLGFLFQILATL